MASGRITGKLVIPIFVKEAVQPETFPTRLGRSRAAAITRAADTTQNLRGTGMRM
jgi:hypothetical protein